MKEDRRNFLKRTCLVGSCLCGFTSLASEIETNGLNPAVGDPDKILLQEWVSTLLFSIDNNGDEAVCRKIMKSCAKSHYDHLQMDNFLKPYENDLEKFNQFIEKEWDWKIDYQKEEGVLIANENKNHCVCPMVNPKKGMQSAILCYCSEGFAELMFSKVAGRPVEANVISSIHRGDDRCRYHIQL
jgi:hypothetical protein